VRLYYSSPTIVNTIVAFNSSGIHANLEEPDTPTLRYNCVSGNTTYDYGGLEDPTGTDGNISLEPLLVRNPDDGGDGWGDDPDTPDVDEGFNDDFGDLRLSPDSPCIDAGDVEALPADSPDLDSDGNTAEPISIDLDGHARVLCGGVDMGAYESGIGDYQCDGDVDLDDFGVWEACMTGPAVGPGDEPYPAGCVAFDFELDGDVDQVDAAAWQRTFIGE